MLLDAARTIPYTLYSMPMSPLLHIQFHFYDRMLYAIRQYGVLCMSTSFFGFLKHSRHVCGYAWNRMKRKIWKESNSRHESTHLNYLLPLCMYIYTFMSLLDSILLQNVDTFEFSNCICNEASEL